MDYLQQQCSPTPEAGNGSDADPPDRAVGRMCILIGLIGVAMLVVVAINA